MKYNITKEQLTNYLFDGYTNREIADAMGCSKSNVWHFITQYGLAELQEKYKLPNYRIDKIDTKEKAYILGAICCDGALRANDIVEMTVAKIDKEMVDFIADCIYGRVRIDNTYDKATRRFPRARLCKKIPDIKTFIGGPAKKDRHFPIVNDELSRYALLGAFDADGCLTWGWRKDKGRIWHKVSFTTSLSIAIGIQNTIIKHIGISTIIRPKSGKEDCFVLEFANRSDILKFLGYIYQDDFVVLKRKYLKYKALRLELEENGESRISEQYRAEPTE